MQHAVPVHLDADNHMENDRMTPRSGIGRNAAQTIAVCCTVIGLLSVVHRTPETSVFAHLMYAMRASMTVLLVYEVFSLIAYWVT